MVHLFLHYFEIQLMLLKIRCIIFHFQKSLILQPETLMQNGALRDSKFHRFSEASGRHIAGHRGHLEEPWEEDSMEVAGTRVPPNYFALDLRLVVLLGGVRLVAAGGVFGKVVREGWRNPP